MKFSHLQRLQVFQLQRPASLVFEWLKVEREGECINSSLNSLDLGPWYGVSFKVHRKHTQRHTKKIQWQSSHIRRRERTSLVLRVLFHSPLLSSPLFGRCDRDVRIRKQALYRMIYVADCLQEGQRDGMVIIYVFGWIFAWPCNLLLLGVSLCFRRRAHIIIPITTVRLFFFGGGGLRRSVCVFHPGPVRLVVGDDIHVVIDPVVVAACAGRFGRFNLCLQPAHSLPLSRLCLTVGSNKKSFCCSFVCFVSIWIKRPLCYCWERAAPVKIHSFSYSTQD